LSYFRFHSFSGFVDSKRPQLYGALDLKINPLPAETKDLTAWLMLELSSCKSLFGLLGGEFDLCGVGSYSKLSVTGNGAPADPVFTVNPTYSYSTWTAGIQFKLAEISL
jgi:hypothetical protein